MRMSLLTSFDHATKHRINKLKCKNLVWCRFKWSQLRVEHVRGAESKHEDFQQTCLINEFDAFTFCVLEVWGERDGGPLWPWNRRESEQQGSRPYFSNRSSTSSSSDSCLFLASKLNNVIHIQACNQSHFTYMGLVQLVLELVFEVRPAGLPPWADLPALVSPCSVRHFPVAENLLHWSALGS